jgi:hypothetical protein
MQAEKWLRAIVAIFILARPATAFENHYEN